MTGINAIGISEAGAFVVGDTHYVNGITGNFQFYIVVTGPCQLYLSAYTLVLSPALDLRHVHRNFDLDQIFWIIQPFAYLLLNKRIRAVDHVMKQQHIATYIKQVNNKKRYGNCLFQYFTDLGLIV